MNGSLSTGSAGTTDFPCVEVKVVAVIVSKVGTEACTTIGDYVAIVVVTGCSSGSGLGVTSGVETYKSIDVEPEVWSL